MSNYTEHLLNINQAKRVVPWTCWWLKKNWTMMKMMKMMKTKMKKKKTNAFRQKERKKWEKEKEKEKKEKGEKKDRFRQIFDSLGLYTLRFDGTLASGQWGVKPNNRSSDSDTTGFFHMTSFDAVRMFWLLDPFAPSLPQWIIAETGKPVNASILSEKAKLYLYNLLLEQELNDFLATTVNCGNKYIEKGIPVEEPAEYIFPDHSVHYHKTNQEPMKADDQILTKNITECQQESEVFFANKNGWTQTFGSQIGIIRSKPGFAERHYIIGLFGNMGGEFFPPEFRSHVQSKPAYAPAFPILGRKIDRFIAEHTSPSDNSAKESVPLAGQLFIFVTGGLCVLIVLISLFLHCRKQKRMQNDHQQILHEPLNSVNSMD
eukprot:TRINITY_DN1173_c1_g1_i1.p1 TRINITY_DN1173_c1_g1~~TRINITY_DN1173_c1_g1_i1.p1  ORF type:complete len:375 (-),score=75.78 TRINITY_DN1173_c1_g1_i1:249-1373(-)